MKGKKQEGKVIWRGKGAWREGNELDSDETKKIGNTWRKVARKDGKADGKAGKLRLVNSAPNQHDHHDLRGFVGVAVAEGAARAKNQHDHYDLFACVLGG